MFMCRNGGVRGVCEGDMWSVWGDMWNVWERCVECVGRYVKCAREVCGVWRVRDECVGSMECCEMCGT